MDPTRFDALAQAFASGVSRRRVLKALMGAAVGGVLSAKGLRSADAFICRSPGVLCAKNAHCCSGSCGADHRCDCPHDQLLCDRTCVDASSDLANCGACGTICTTEIPAATAVCQDGTCGVECDSGMALCGDACCDSDQTCTMDEICCTPAICQSGQCGSIQDQCGSEISCGGCGECQQCVDGTCSNADTGTTCGTGNTSICDHGNCFLTYPNCGNGVCSLAYHGVDAGTSLTLCTLLTPDQACSGFTCTTTSDCFGGQFCMETASCGSRCVPGCTA